MRSDYTIELKNLIKTLHANHIEMVMEMFLIKESSDFILDCARYWVTQYHIDGIHLYVLKLRLSFLQKTLFLLIQRLLPHIGMVSVALISIWRIIITVLQQRSVNF